MNVVIEPIVPTLPTAIEQRVILRGVSWATYERLLAEHEEVSSTHFTYDRGALEIMVLSARHENYKDMLVLLINVLAEEMGIDLGSFGSTTLRREDLARGFEPDACFYIQHEAQVRGKEQLDLRVDPPPDLVLEIDIISPSLDKLPLYAAMGVAEVWRYDGQNLNFYWLQANADQAQPESRALPGLTSQVVAHFLAESQSLKRTVWLRRVREWARNNFGVK